jgi:hypothetical protein
LTHQKRPFEQAEVPAYAASRKQGGPRRGSRVPGSSDPSTQSQKSSLTLAMGIFVPSAQANVLPS